MRYDHPLCSKTVPFGLDPILELKKYILDPYDWDLITKHGYTYTEQDFGGFFYKMYDKMNWHDGKKTCEADGTKMVVPKSEEENSFIANLKPGQDCCSNYLNHMTFLKFHNRFLELGSKYWVSIEILSQFSRPTHIAPPWQICGKFRLWMAYITL